MLYVNQAVSGYSLRIQTGVVAPSLSHGMMSCLVDITATVG